MASNETRDGTTHEDTTKPLDGVETEGAKKGVKLSKRAKREQRWEELKKRQREGRREEKKRRDQKKREAGIKLRREKVLLSDARASKVCVAIDCTYNQLMTEREREGLGKQIKYCYAANRNSPHPLQLYLSGYSQGISETLSKSAPEHAKWDMHLLPNEITAVFSANQITYLTADSPNVITELTADRCYVIGGLLDHNRHKGTCLERAEKMEVSHGRLALGEVVELRSRSVLAVNHVFDILLRLVTIMVEWNGIISGLFIATRGQGTGRRPS